MNNSQLDNTNCKETAKFVRYVVKGKLHNNKWHEVVEVPYGHDSKEYVLNLIKDWNYEELSRREINPKYPVDIRELISIHSETEGVSQKITFCEWEKLNLVTIMEKGHSPYDLLECVNCGQQVKRVILGKPNIQCHPDRTCATCHKVYKSKKSFKIHQNNQHRILQVAKSKLGDTNS